MRHAFGRRPRFLQVVSFFILGFAASVPSWGKNADEPRTPEETDALFESFDAAVEQWLHDIEFVASYERTWWRAESAEKGLRGEYAFELDQKRISGVLNKAFGLVRCSGDYESPTKVLSESSDGFSEITRIDFDEVSSNEAAVVYRPLINPERPRPSANFSSRFLPNGKELETSTAGWTSHRKISPLSYIGGVPGYYLKVPPQARDVQRDVVQMDADRAVFAIDYRLASGTAESRVTFRMGGSVPVVERFSMIRRYPTRTIALYALADEFVECPGGPVPRHVRYVLQNPHPEHPDAGWVVANWHSPDLGDRQPTPADFRIPVPEETRIRGLRDPQIALVDGALDVSRVSPADLGRRRRAPAGQRALEKTETPQTMAYGWLILVHVLVIATVIVLLLIRRTRQQGPAA